MIRNLCCLSKCRDGTTVSCGSKACPLVFKANQYDSMLFFFLSTTFIFVSAMHHSQQYAVIQHYFWLHDVGFYKAKAGIRLFGFGVLYFYLFIYLFIYLFLASLETACNSCHRTEKLAFTFRAVLACVYHHP